MEDVKLSIVVTVHAESILLHRTLRSILRSTKLLDEARVNWELLIHVDNGSPETLAYIKAYRNFLKPFTIFYNSFGDLGASRNFTFAQASGKFITCIDADDLMSERWLIDGYNLLASKTYGKYVVHTAMTVEFGDFNSIVQKYGEIDQSTDTLLSVWSGRWNSVIMTSRELLLANPYPKNEPGYGYEDWNLSCSFLLQGAHNVLVPQTVIFVRRKENGSEWDRQRHSRSVLKAHPLLSFSNFRKLDVGLDVTDSEQAVRLPKATVAQRVKHTAKPIFAKFPVAEKYARHAYGILRNVKDGRAVPAQSPDKKVPAWLKKEWLAMHVIDKSVFPDPTIITNTPVYHTITPDHYRVGEAYWQMVRQTRHNNYGYILFVPWLVEGGADLFAINYANYMARLNPGKHVLVLATNANSKSPWRHKLDSSVDFISFGNIAADLPLDQQNRLLEQLVENSGAQVLHILNSALGYDFIYSHQAYLRGSHKRIIATSYSQSSDKTGRIYGFSHTHVPKVYDLLDYITTDNQAVIDMWQQEYGFDPAKLILHHQPFDVAKFEHHTHKKSRAVNNFHVLWAARLAPEKIPELVGEIGKILEQDNIRIDMYGTAAKGFDTSFLRHLPKNVIYKGSFNGITTLPLRDYDAFLYTSLFDGTPNTLVEVGLSRLPIVSSAVGGIPDLIEDGQTGLLVHDTHDAKDYAIALKKIHATPAVGADLSDSLYKKIREEFDAEQFSNALEDLCRKIDY